MPVTRDASAVWRYLNGIVCVYKPNDTSVNNVIKAVKNNIVRDLNTLECRPQKKHVLIEGGEHGKKMSVRVIPSYADHVLAVGPRYEYRDVSSITAVNLGMYSSGVMMLGINSRGNFEAKKVHEECMLRVLRVSGRFGRATDSGWADFGRATMKAKFLHVPREALDRVLAALQASHQRLAFMHAGIDPLSQEAYDLLKTGLLKPKTPKTPLIYGARCVDFNLPDFTIEIQSVGETEDFLLQMLEEIARRVRSVAACTSIRCIQHGPLSLEDALVRNQWNLEHIVHNMTTCREKLDNYWQQEKADPKLVQTLS